MFVINIFNESIIRNFKVRCQIVNGAGILRRGDLNHFELLVISIVNKIYVSNNESFFDKACQPFFESGLSFYLRRNIEEGPSFQFRNLQ